MICLLSENDLICFILCLRSTQRSGVLSHAWGFW